MKLIGVGTIKEKYLKKAIYLKKERIEQKLGIEIISVEDEKCPESLSDKEKEEVKQKEGERILHYVKPEDYVVALTLEGKPFQQEKFQKKLHQKNICFIIGGSLGISAEVRKRANDELSFGPMTYPHQLMRWILLEQIDQGL